jgi:hypothetical protein
MPYGGNIGIWILLTHAPPLVLFIMNFDFYNFFSCIEHLYFDIFSIT